MTHTIAIRRDAVVLLEHAIARLGHYNNRGWMTCDDSDSEAVYILQHAQWGLEAMDSPACNRFWDSERRKYDEAVANLGQAPEFVPVAAQRNL